MHFTESAQQEDWCQRGTLFQSLREENLLGGMIDTRPHNVPSRESRPVWFPPPRDMIGPAIITVVPITPSIPPAKTGTGISTLLVDGPETSTQELLPGCLREEKRMVT
jgi:hypothetical protein